MNYETFKETLKQSISERMGDGFNVAINQTMKTNQVLDSLTILKSGDSISPNFYLKLYFSEFEKGKTFSSIRDEIIDNYLNHRNSICFSPEQFMDFNYIKDKIAYKLINTEKNLKLLKGVPNLQFHDLSIVFYCIFELNDCGLSSAMIQNNHMKIWGTDAVELKKVADLNTPRLLPYSLKSMNEVMKDMMTHEFDLSESDHDLFNDFLPASQDESMYVLTNTKGINGAAALFYSKVLDEFSESHGSFFILPSSVHELLLIPSNRSISKENLKDMVMDVNRTQVAADEFLSNSLYFYDSETQLISM